MRFHKITATTFGIGYIKKGGGTVAAVATCLVWYAFASGSVNIIPGLIATLFITALGIWSGNVVESVWGKDNNRVVIDEVAGMCISLLWIPVTPLNVVLALILFRVFDIGKPFYIKRLEHLPGGWGVMFDDVLAGIYANIILQIYLRVNLN